ncbi:MAG: c-type cytochrome [Chromatiales bacterium]|nr:c-type cytochrome [Chromatiales bacterium]
MRNLKPLLTRSAALLLPALLIVGCSNSGPGDTVVKLSTDPVLDATCGMPINTLPGGALVRVDDIAGDVELEYTVSVNPNSPALLKAVNVSADDKDAGLTEQQPRFGGAVISLPAGDVTLDVAIKRPYQRPDLMWMEWFVINDEATGIADAKFKISGLAQDFVVYDLNTDIWAGPIAKPELILGAVAPEGVTKLIVGIGTADGSALADIDIDATIDFTVSIAGKATQFAATNSRRLALTADDAEVWATVPEANTVRVVDTATQDLVASIAVPGAPRGMAITPDNQLALTLAPNCNQLVVMDVAKREVVQVFGEAEGIGREPREVVISADGARAYVSSFVGDTLAVFERRADGFAHVKTLATGRRPTGLSVTPDGKAVFVAHYLPRGPLATNESWISVFDTEKLQLLTDDAVVPDGGNPEYTACLQQLSMFARYTPEELMMEGPFSMLRGTYLNPAGTEALVPSMVVVPFVMFEGDMVASGLNRPMGRITTSNILGFDTRTPATTHTHPLDTTFDIRDRGLEFQKCAAHTANMEYPHSYTDPKRPGLRTANAAMHPTGETGLKPTGQVRSVAYTRGGRRAFLVSYSSDELVLVDPSTRHPLTLEHYMLDGNNPIDMVFTSDGATAYVAYANSLHLSVLDTSAYAQTVLPRPAYVPFWLSKKLIPQRSASLVSYARVTRDVRDVTEFPAVSQTGKINLLDADPMDPVLRRGRTLFASSNPDKYPTLTAHPEGGCVICHGDGGNDGSMWVMIDGERRTTSLRGGVGGRGWLKTKATNTDARQISDQFSRELLGGTGLSDPDLDALATYVAWGIPRLQAPVTDPAKVAQGEALFAENCSSCHMDSITELARRDELPPFGGAPAPVLYDVGTRTDYAGASMGKAHQDLFERVPVYGEIINAVVGDRAFTEDDVVFRVLAATPRPNRSAEEFKAPSLVNVWENALFYHDGRFDELRDAVEYMAVIDNLALTDAETDALVEYLRTF